jgi:hypothetical protein
LTIHFPNGGFWSSELISKVRKLASGMQKGQGEFSRIRNDPCGNSEKFMVGGDESKNLHSADWQLDSDNSV